MSLRLGVDIGGTNTDAVLVNGDDRVVARAKTPTTPDVISGIRAALGKVLTPAPLEPVVAAMLGTTQCTNAVVERRGLRSVAIVRLGAPATAAVPPFADWPDDLREAVSGHVALVRGGHDFTPDRSLRRSARTMSAVPQPLRRSTTCRSRLSECSQRSIPDTSGAQRRFVPKRPASTIRFPSLR